MSVQRISNEFAKIIDRKLIAELMKEYSMTKRFHYLEDWEKSILHAGKFSEITLAVIKNIVDKQRVILYIVPSSECVREITSPSPHCSFHSHAYKLSMILNFKKSHERKYNNSHDGTCQMSDEMFKQ